MTKFIIICVLIIFAISMSYIYSTYDSNIKEGFLFTINRPKLYDDPLFDDVIFYDNDDQDDEYGLLGIEKCEIANLGRCVEFGITGNAVCFPSYKPLGGNYNSIPYDGNI